MTAPISTRTDLAALAGMDPAVRERSVTTYLEHARDQLTLAVNLSGPEAVAALKAEIATAAEATKQLGLSKEIQTDAQEMVRRAEYALAKSIRAGQEDGTVARQGNSRPFRDYHLGGTEVEPRPVRLADLGVSNDELSGTGSSVGMYALADGVSGPQFEAALSDAREEGNVSRANVVRKIKGVKSDGLTPVEKIVTIREMAGRGHTSDQIAREVGATEEYVRRRARECDIDIPGDRVMSRTRRLDHTKFVNETVVQLEALASGLDVLDLSQVDRSQIANWSTSLTDSLRALNRLAKQIKEMDQ